MPDARWKLAGMQDDEAKVCPGCGTRYDRAAIFCQHDGQRLALPEQPPDPYIGQLLLDQFRIEELIGAGGMGTVYRAHQTTIDRDVAIKILHPELTQNADAVRRFQREAKVASKLDHPNVTRVFLFGQLPDGSLYLVMPFLSGRSLQDVLHNRGALQADRSLHIAMQICAGVGEAHAHGVVHRDVKPENVLLVDRAGDPDFVKVLDFGVARWMSGEQTIATQTGLIFGTARYISPEGAAGEPTDARSDVYSIAVLTYQMLAGSTPFDASAPVALLMKHIHERPPELTSRAPHFVPPTIADVVMRALSKNPEARPDDAHAFGVALREAAATDGVLLSMPSPGQFPSVRPQGPVGAPTIQGAPAQRTPTPVLPVVGPGRGALDGASRPFTDPTGQLRVPGLGGGRRGPGAFATVLFAFILGAGAVTAGAWMIQRLVRDEAVVDVEELEERARGALARGDIDTPAGENVADLTARMLAIDPISAPARELRREAARRLREEAATARGQGFIDEARARYERALVLVPDDASTTRALSELELAAAPPRVVETASIRVVPEGAGVGAPLTIIAVTDHEFPEGVAPRFVLDRNGRSQRELAAQPDPDGGRWMVAYTFRRSGDYGVTLQAEGDDYALRTTLTVTSAGNAQRRPASEDGPVTTQQASRTLRGRQPTDTPSSDGIDWRLPGETPREPPQPIESQPIEPRPNGPQPPPTPPPAAPEPSPEPPAPWTSGNVL